MSPKSYPKATKKWPNRDLKATIKGQKTNQNASKIQENSILTRNNGLAKQANVLKNSEMEVFFSQLYQFWPDSHDNFCHALQNFPLGYWFC